MRKTIMFLVAATLTSGLFAQSDKYIKAMEPKVMAIDTAHSLETLQDLANSFERIGDAEKTQWTAYYYAALAHVNYGNMISQADAGGDFSAKTDPEADKAEQLLNKAEELSKNNSEIYIVRKKIASLRMMANPMARYQKYGPLAAQALATAKTLDPENPRIYLLEGEDRYFTPEQYGGSKDEGKKLFAMAQQKFDTAKPANTIAPNWGRGELKYMLSMQ